MPAGHPIVEESMLVLVGPEHERFRVSDDTPAQYLLDRWLIGVADRAGDGGSVLLCDHVRASRRTPSLKVGLVVLDPEFSVDFMECPACLAARWSAKAELDEGWDIEPSCDLCGDETRELLPAFRSTGPVTVFGLLCAGCHAESCGVSDAA